MFSLLVKQPVRFRGADATLPRATADVAQAERPELFAKKLAVCAAVYNFRVEDEVEAKEEKRQTLLEMIDFVNVKKSITEAMYKDTIDMVRAPARRRPNARAAPAPGAPAPRPSVLLGRAGGGGRVSYTNARADQEELVQAAAAGPARL